MAEPELHHLNAANNGKMSCLSCHF